MCLGSVLLLYDPVSTKRQLFYKWPHIWSKILWYTDVFMVSCTLCKTSPNSHPSTYVFEVWYMLFWLLRPKYSTLLCMPIELCSTCTAYFWKVSKHIPPENCLNVCFNKEMEVCTLQCWSFHQWLIINRTSFQPSLLNLVEALEVLSEFNKNMGNVGPTLHECLSGQVYLHYVGHVSQIYINLLYHKSHSCLLKLYSHRMQFVHQGLNFIICCV